MMSRLRSGAVGLAVWVLAIAVPAGQSQTPNVTHTVAVEGTVVDAGLIALPGVHVTLESSSAKPMTQVSDANGHFLFAAVIPGPYHVRAELAETTTLVRDIVVRPAPDSQRLPIVLSSVRSNTGQTVRPVSMQGALPTSSTVSLTGVVVDSSGGVIPGATVVVKDPGTGVSTTVVSNNSGQFTVPSLDSGTYEVTVTLSGFKTWKSDNVKLSAGSSANLAVKLEIGVMTDTKQVVATTDVVDTASTQVAATISADQINNLPLVTKNALNFVTFLPGVNSGSTHSQRSSTILGLPQSTIAITIDGVNVQDQGLHSTDGFFAVIRSADGPRRRSHRAGDLRRHRGVSAFGAQSLRGRAPLAALDLRRRRGHRVLLERPPIPRGRAAAAGGCRSRRGHLNYFVFTIPTARDRPVAPHRSGPCPWEPSTSAHRARAKNTPEQDAGSRNLVLLSTSGSMSRPNRLPLVKRPLAC